eukprot:TRINITY_DN5669_c0_g1_i1.p1 TRINITY_DN5669_c0_g1~~TRINITY_DN5669_c0_g1_i1.p1  ORF type:complete len:224 (-),score=43.47 TRINITY_DN5669_c0_g1_i1:3-674(-)
MSFVYAVSSNAVFPAATGVFSTPMLFTNCFATVSSSQKQPPHNEHAHICDYSPTRNLYRCLCLRECTGRYNITQLRQTAVVPDVSDLKSWAWQICTEFGWLFSVRSSSSAFSGLNVAVGYLSAVCEEGFGVPGLLPNVTATNALYGGKAIAETVSNTLFSVGSNDPWLANNVDIDGRFAASNQLVVDDGAHCAAFYPATPQDSAAVLQARVTVGQFIRKMIQE